MPNFIDRLNGEVNRKQSKLAETLKENPRLGEEKSLHDLVQDHWFEFPNITPSDRRPAVAVDGSSAVRHLANSAFLFVTQGFLMGENGGIPIEETDVDVAILPGGTYAPFISEASQLMMVRLEALLARRGAELLAPRGIVLIDGALYGILPNIYPFKEYQQEQEPDFFATYREDALTSYLALFEMTKSKQLMVVSIAKTSTQSTHTQVWWRDCHTEKPPKISDSEALYRWTHRTNAEGMLISRARGYSHPILLGTHAFAEGRQKDELLSREDVQNAPAIVSFFVRLDDFDDAMRIDVPATCIGRSETIGSVEEEQLVDPAQVEPILELLMADYGGMEVYNALLYGVDREVRLRQDTMDQVYIPLIENVLRESDSKIELRLDRSERRFHSR